MTSDFELRGLLLDRRRLQRELAGILRRIGPNHPPAERAKLNTARRIKRLELRRALRSNAEAIAARCDFLFPEEAP